MQRLQDVLSGKENNYLVPLFWQHGEDEAVLRELMEKILESGIREVCLEARPHPDFCGPLWWRDVDIIMDQAKKTGMRVWIFDDSQFPTGWANGKAANAEKRLRKSHINYRVIDICGPRTGCSVLLSDQECENLISLTLCQKIENKNEMAPPFLNLTPKVKDGCCFFDVPEGLWRAVVVFEDDTCGAFRNYINMMNADSVQILVDEVYESHYARYKDEFGKTLAGFFTDEPGFYNVMSYEGKMGMPFPLPWTQGLLERLSQSLGEDAVPYLAGLWFDIGEATKKIRYCYMDTVSNLYKTCFCDKLGDWCRSHGVEYMGHIIEDNSAHARLADSCGHFFRALWGQDLSGIDVVLGQVLPGLDDENTKNMTGYGDGSFFHYGLAKLGSSLAHIDPKKKGRALCEIYGAYGWMEGLRLMKWLTDHMLVRGINYMMPHAFSPRPFPDPDCPPHFYARGENMQFPYMSYLFHYINRMCHLLNGGLHVPAAAVAYHAEAEWAGEATLFHKVGEQLMKRQLDYDVIPWDVLYEAEVQDKKLTINGESYPCLLVPYAQRLPQKAFDTLQRFCQAGLPVAFEGGLPQEAADGGTAPDFAGVDVVPLGDAAAWAARWGGQEIVLSTPWPELRFYHYQNGGADFYMFFNEHPSKAVTTMVTFPSGAPSARYDAFKNQLYAVESEKDAVCLSLAPYESALFVKGETEGTKTLALPTKGIGLLLSFTVSAKEAGQEAFGEAFTVSGYENLAERMPRFSGTLCYEAVFEAPEASGTVYLDLGEVFETSEVWLNGVPCGLAICPPYRHDITGAVQKGENRLKIYVTNTLAKRERDGFSACFPQDPTGILGPITLLTE